MTVGGDRFSLPAVIFFEKVLTHSSVGGIL